MNNREQNLAKLESLQAAKKAKISAKDKDIVITDAEAFVKALQIKIEELRKALNTDVQVNVDPLVEQLKQLKPIAPLINNLRLAIAGIVIPEMPDKVSVIGLDQLSELLTRHISELKKLPDVHLPEANVKVSVEQINRENVKRITERLDKIIKAVEDNGASQDASDFIPVRRVKKVGNRLLFDDDTWSGGGGGGGGGSLLFSGQSSGVAESTSTIYDGNTALTPKFAVISTGTNGDNTIVAAVAGKKIRVLSYMFISSGTVTAKWQSSGTDVSGAMAFIANTGVSSGYNPKGHFETVTEEALEINQNSTAVLAGHLNYIEVDG